MFKFFKKSNPIGETYTCTWWMNQVNKPIDVQVIAAFLTRMERQKKVVRIVNRDNRATFAPAPGFTAVDVRNELVTAVDQWKNKGDKKW